jgi:hypothetical protein
MPSYEVTITLLIDAKGEHRSKGDVVDGAAFGELLPRYIEIGAVKEASGETPAQSDTAPLTSETPSKPTKKK